MEQYEVMIYLLGEDYEFEIKEKFKYSNIQEAKIKFKELIKKEIPEEKEKIITLEDSDGFIYKEKTLKK